MVALAELSAVALMGVAVGLLAWLTRAGRQAPKSLSEASRIASRPIRKVGT